MGTPEDAVEPVDLLIRGGRVLVDTVDAGAKFVDCHVGISKGQISSLSEHGCEPAAREVLDATGHLVTPGFVNAHTHSYAAISSGLGADAPLEVLIPAARTLVGPLSEDDRYLAAKQLAESLLRAGITTVLDQPAQGIASPSGTALAYQEMGIRAYVAPMVADLPYDRWLSEDSLSNGSASSSNAAAGKPDTKRILADVEAFVATWSETEGLVKPAIGPFAPGVCTDALLEGLGGLAKRYRLPMHTHLAEAEWQAKRSLRDQGKRMVNRLADLGLLGPTFSMAHGIWLEDEECKLLGDAGSSVVHNPLSNLMLGSGIAPIARLRAEGVGIALGTDGPNCGCVVDFFEHMRLSVAVHRAGQASWQEWARAEDALTWATAGGARALGAQSEIGHIKCGHRADLVVHRGRRQQGLDSGATITSFVYAGSASDVLHVVVDGHIRVRDGHLTGPEIDGGGRDVQTG